MLAKRKTNAKQTPKKHAGLRVCASIRAGEQQFNCNKEGTALMEQLIPLMPKIGKMEKNCPEWEPK